MLKLSRIRLSCQTASALAGLAALEAIYVALHRLGNLKLFVVELVALGLAGGVVYFLALYAFEHCRESRAAFWLILAGALLFRLTLAPLVPTLSTDINRYRWDGHVQAAGWNPYAVAPEDPRLRPLRDATWSTMPGPEIPTIYPPLVELVYAATWRVLPGPVGFKLPFLLADLLVVGLLAWWVRTTGARNYQLAIYAWNPLVVVEFAANGHNDALALAGLVFAVLIIRRRGTVSTVALAAAALVKVFPVVLGPLWLRRTRWRNLIWAAGLAALCAWPYRSAWPGILKTLAYYETRWRDYNASLYAVLHWMSGSYEVAAGIGGGIVAGLAVWLAARRADPARAAYLLIGAILLLGPNGYPRYFTWIVPLLCLLPEAKGRIAWLLLTVLLFLSNKVVIDFQAFGRWHFDPLMQWLTYAPFYALLVLQTWRHRRFSKSAETARAS